MAKPYVCVIDMDPSVAEALKGKRFSVEVGTFGTPHLVERSEQSYVVNEGTSSPSDSAEQDIVIADLRPPRPGSACRRPEGIIALWQVGSTGVIDPRPISMETHRQRYNRILAHGGVFVIFAYPRMVGVYAVGIANTVEVRRRGEPYQASN